jgi:hypothetical protein
MRNVDINVEGTNVDGWLNILNGYASSAISSANSLANSLNYFYPPYYNSSVGFDEVNTGITLTPAEVPVAPILNVSPKTVPVAPTFITPTISVPAAPTFTTPAPSINFPDVPSPLTSTLPILDYVIKTDFNFPEDYTYVLPSVPTMFDLNIPTPQSIVLPTFDIAFPTSNGIRIPDITFAFNENIYSDQLLTDVKDLLIYRLQGSTGLPPVVEAAIWNRDRDREQTAALQSERTLLVERSGVGFTRPTGSVQAALTQVVQETQSKLIDLSREIMIKQAELEQENLKNSIQQVIALEDILVRQNNNINQRSFEVSKYTQDVAIEIFKSRVALFSTEVAAYQSYATAFNYKVQAELAKIEIFKAEIDSQRLISEVNKNTISLYLAQIDGVKAGADIYKTIIDSVKSRIDAEQLKLEIFKTKVEAYSEGVRAKASEYTMYSEQIKGELAKVDVYDSSVKAFASKIQAYSAQSDVVLKTASTQVDIEDLFLKKFTAEMDGYSKQVQADQLIYQGAIDVYKGEAEIYMSKIGFNKASAELALKSADNVIQQNKSKADLAIENAKVTLQSLIASYNATLEGKKAAGNMYTTIGSSALQAINVSAQVRGDSSVSGSEVYQYTGPVA